jgi:REP element-mobilizing transposase RayT
VPSPLRDETPGYHHVWCRGNNKRPIVVDDRDRLALLKQIDVAARMYGWEVVAYCVMDNHYHLVIGIDERGMADGFCRINTFHATQFNRRHGRVNHLFGKRYGNKLLDDEPSLLEACRYVVLNPVRAAMVERPEEFRWSSYRGTTGVGDADLPLAPDVLLGSLHRDQTRARELFAHFVLNRVPVTC